VRKRKATLKLNKLVSKTFIKTRNLFLTIYIKIENAEFNILKQKKLWGHNLRLLYFLVVFSKWIEFRFIQWNLYRGGHLKEGREKSAKNVFICLWKK